MTDVIVVEDHVMVAEGLARIIDGSGEARVVGRHHNLTSCRAALTGLPREGVMLLDIELPDGNGVDFCAEVRRERPDLRVVMLTGFKEFNIARHALRNGAAGYVLKNADTEEILAAIEAVGRGEQFLCEQIGLLLRDKQGTEEIWLTAREKEILRHIAQGYTTGEIADMIFRDTDTVKKHRKNLFIKLRARNMADLVIKGREMNLI